MREDGKKAINCKNNKEEMISMASFEQAVNEIGFGAAVVKFQEQLPLSFWNSLTIKQCKEIYQEIRSWDSEVRRRVDSRLEELNADPKHWIEIYYKSPLHLKIEKKIREMVVAKYKKCTLAKS